MENNTKSSKKQKLQGQEISEFIRLEEELHQLQEQYNIPVKKGKFYEFMEKVMELKEKPHPVVRKRYLWLAVLTGWIGGHRFYAKQYITAALSVALFWTGIPAAMTIIDIMGALPKEADEKGEIIV